MKNWKLWLLIVALVIAQPLLAQSRDHDQGHGHDHGEGDHGEMDAQMAAFIEIAQPSAEHEFLRRLEGSWTANARFWMATGAPPNESTGVSTNRMILGGRFLQSSYEGPSPFGVGNFKGAHDDRRVSEPDGRHGQDEGCDDDHQ